jgi:two-component system, cell cycle sensor histidine kinase and response regulator CckA
MSWNGARSESLKVGWNFYQRAVDNYSIIVRIMELEERDLLIGEAPRILIEESFFDMCTIIINENGAARQAFYAIDDTFGPVDAGDIKNLEAWAGRSAVIEDHFNYGTVYVYTIQRSLETIGYIVLGKRYRVDLKPSQIRDLEVIGELYGMALMRGQTSVPKSDNGVFETVLESFPDPLVLVDMHGYIGYANRKAKEHFETRKGFFLNERADKAIPGLPEALVKDRKPFSGEINYRSDNNYRVYRVESFIVPEVKDGEWLAIVFKDIVEAKANEEEKFLRKRNESVGMLAGGIAHDFNNMLTGILGYAALMKKMINDVQLGRYAEAIEHSAQRASGLTKHLLNFSRRQKRSAGLMDINLLLDDVLFLISKSFHNINVILDFNSMLPAIRGDEAELQNVFLNLFVNARDAMDGEGGTLKVSTSRYDGGYVCIQIEDTGKGIDETLRHKIFEPYFSTKEDAENLGMGLYLVDKVIKEHGGFIEIKSEPAKGACFELYLPVPSGQPAATSKPKLESSEKAIEKKKILIVDDEPLIRELLKNYLAAKGAYLLEAENGEKALDMYREHRDSIDLIVLDVIMPGIKGDEVLRQIRKDTAKTKVIISSGFMSEQQREKLKGLSVDGFLDKPFKDDSALSIIGEVLSKPETANG